MVSKNSQKVEKAQMSQREWIRARNQDPFISEEQPDQTPIHIPGITDRDRPLTLREEMQRFIKTEVSQAAQQNEIESFEESNDFDMEENDLDMLTPYSVVTEMVPEPSLPLESLDGEPNQEDVEADNPIPAEPSLQAQPAENLAATEP